MICPRCLVLLPHDLAHVQEHAALCVGNSVEEFLSKFASLAGSVERMVRAGGLDPLPSLGEAIAGMIAHRAYGLDQAAEIGTPEEIAAAIWKDLNRPSIMGEWLKTHR